MRNMTFWFIVFIVLGFLTGCDEFALKKTATILQVSGTITYEPDIPQLSLALSYEMMNYRPSSIREVYLYCHENVVIESLKEGDISLRVEQGIPIGMSVRVYRVRVSEWLPGTRRVFSMKAHIKGKEESQGFFLSSEGVFLESSKVWIPISFDEIPAFRYQLTVQVPAGYETIMGGRVVSESPSEQFSTSLWRSQSTNLLFSGNLIIGKFQKVGEKDMYLYLPQKFSPLQEKRLSLLLDLLKEGKNILSKYIGEYPFDVRVVFLPKDITPLEPWTDGLFLGNILLFEESLAFSLTNVSRSVLDTIVLSETSWLYLVKTILHEMSHSYLGYDLRWEREETLPIESLTETTSLKLLEWLSPETYKLAINRALYDWNNLKLIAQTPQQLYLYRNLLLATTLSPKTYFKLIRGLRGRYLYSKLDENVLFQTLLDHGETNLSFLSGNLWNTVPEWNISLVSTNTGISISHTYPFTLSVDLFLEDKHSSITNIPLEIENSLVYPVSMRNFPSFWLDGSLLWLDHTPGDTILSQPWASIVSNLTLYYAGETNIGLDIQVTPSDKKLRSPQEDRFLSLVAFSSLDIIYHKHEKKENKVFLYAYKKSKERLCSYAVFVFTQDTKKWKWEGVYDPSIPYQIP
ncbi:M1 aminopeptidase family protein [Thermospira aquatica]|uniref:Peptidase M1 membrane alanine aminopeptidase domain-containing protein n=1 Tax=Thermospira aquatica TaxID=2828656 RepID=A0AAX3BFW6_9SPIR|nr:hypothetical protein [Thermospira aquatica]URA11114.1 hypothetical protein KDW03_04775 [Thermospira aquatica]